MHLGNANSFYGYRVSLELLFPFFVAGKPFANAITTIGAKTVQHVGYLLIRQQVLLV